MILEQKHPAACLSFLVSLSHILLRATHLPPVDSLHMSLEALM